MYEGVHTVIGKKTKNLINLFQHLDRQVDMLEAAETEVTVTGLIQFLEHTAVLRTLWNDRETTSITVVIFSSIVHYWIMFVKVLVTIHNVFFHQKVLQVGSFGLKGWVGFC